MLLTLHSRVGQHPETGCKYDRTLDIRVCAQVLDEADDGHSDWTAVLMPNSSPDTTADVSVDTEFAEARMATPHCPSQPVAATTSMVCG